MIIDVNGIELQWTVTGEGEPLLWLHGLMGAGEDWRHVFPEPPTGFSVIAPDLRGHGASTNPSGDFAFRQCAQDVLALLAHLNLSAVKAIGLSGGGITLLHMATMQPASIDTMVLISAPPYFPAQVRQIQRQFSETILGDEEMQRMRARHRHGTPQIQQLFEITRRLADSYDDVSFTPPYLATIRAQTLIVFGDRDPLYPVSLAFELRNAIPDAHLWIIPNAGHGPVFGEHAPGFAKTALPFLRGQWGKESA
jgi:pimeloyl-ACP methyl ester carboxylesterase